MEVIIHPKVPLILEIKSTRQKISLIPFDFECKFKNVKKEKGLDYDPKEHIKWWAYLYFDWIGLSFQFTIKSFK